MKIELAYDTAEDVPAEFKALYTEADGKFVLTGVNGIKTQTDIDRLQEALRKERTDHSATKTKLQPFTSLGDLEEVKAKLDKYPELEALAEASGNKIDDKKLEGIVNGRVAPLQRELEAARATITELSQKNGELTGSLTKRDIHEDVRKAALAAKITDTALEDVLMLADHYFERADGKTITRDVGGIMPGLDPAAWIAEQREKRPHWWPGSLGAGAGGGRDGGGGADNPWSKAKWSVTAQTAFIQEKGIDKARQMAAAAGSFVGARSPADKK